MGRYRLSKWNSIQNGGEARTHEFLLLDQIEQAEVVGRKVAQMMRGAGAHGMDG